MSASASKRLNNGWASFSLFEALSIDVLSKSAKIYLDCRAMGYTPEGMSQAQMAEMTKAFNLPR